MSRAHACTRPVAVGPEAGISAHRSCVANSAADTSIQSRDLFSAGFRPRNGLAQRRQRTFQAADFIDIHPRREFVAKPLVTLLAFAFDGLTQLLASLPILRYLVVEITEDQLPVGFTPRRIWACSCACCFSSSCKADSSRR